MQGSTDLGGDNVALGRSALYANDTGVYNVALGYTALRSNTTGAYNIAIGSGAMYLNTTGQRNVAIGGDSLNETTSGIDNVAVGVYASKLNQSGGNNVALGRSALQSNIGASGNIAVGNYALYDLDSTGATFNTVVGHGSGSGIVTGVNNTIIGAQVGGLSSSLSNNIIIADGAGNRRINVNSSGFTGIGTTTPTTALQVEGQITPAADNTYDLGDASLRFTAVYATNGTIQTSDEREKRDIKNSDLGLNFLNELRPVSFRWKKSESGSVHYGLIAQEAQKAITHSRAEESENVIVQKTKSGVFGLNYSELISPIIKAIQEISSNSESMRLEISELKATNAALEARLNKLENTTSVK